MADSFGGPPSGGGGIGGDSFWVGIIAPAQGGGGGGGGLVGADDPSAPAPYKYTWIPAGLVGGNPAVAPLCDAGFGTPGWPYTMVIQDLSGAIVGTEQRCVPLDPGAAQQPPPAPQLPPVPTIGEIWRVAMRQIPPPKIGINPRPRGLTGLETWLWYDGPQTIQISTGIGEWTVTGTAHVDQVTFDMGDGRTATATSAGSEAAPAARFVYETKGTYHIVATARWVAEVALTGPGLPARATPIGAAVLRSSEDYPVQEVRGVLVPDPPR